MPPSEPLSVHAFFAMQSQSVSTPKAPQMSSWQLFRVRVRVRVSVRVRVRVRGRVRVRVRI